MKAGAVDEFKRLEVQYQIVGQVHPAAEGGEHAASVGDVELAGQANRAPCRIHVNRDEILLIVWGRTEGERAEQWT